MYSLYPDSVKDLIYYPPVLLPEEFIIEPVEILKTTKHSDATSTGKIKYTKEELREFLSQISTLPTIFLKYLSISEIHFDIFCKEDDKQILQFIEYFHEKYPRTGIFLRQFISTSKYILYQKNKIKLFLKILFKVLFIQMKFFLLRNYWIFLKKNLQMLIHLDHFIFIVLIRI